MIRKHNLFLGIIKVQSLYNTIFRFHWNGLLEVNYVIREQFYRGVIGK